MQPDINESKHFRIHILDRPTKESLRKEFGKIEQHLNIDGFGDVLSAATFELVENAIRANLKRVYFKKFGYRLDEPDSYQQGIKAFKTDLNKVFTREEFDSALKDLELVVSVMLDLNQSRLITWVENNTLMQAEEERRIRQKLALAMQAERLTDIYLHYADETEGSGLGLAMIIFLIKGIGFDPENFRVFQQDGKTVARLEFPLNKDYVPLRKIEDS